MSNDKTERRCKSCNKLLLDEKLPFCPRCMWKGRNKAGQIGGFVGLVGGIGTAIASGWKMINNNDHPMDDSSDDEMG